MNDTLLQHLGPGVSLGNLTPVMAILACAGLAGLFVGLLYVWPQDLPRDHPTAIKRRFASVAVASVASPFVVVFLGQPTPHGFTPAQWLGFPSTGVLSYLAAATLPMLLVAVLFAGPLLLRALPAYPDLSDPWYSDLSGWRNIVVGPLTEELVFRGCMIPLLAGAGASRAGIVFGIPVFFALAHVHHVLQHMRKTGLERRNAMLGVAAQLVITSIFGALSAFLFLRTGHVLAPTLAHMFCNWIGPPDIPGMLEHPRRPLLLTVLLLGFIAFWVLLFPMTDPSLYNTLYWRIIGTSYV